MALYAIGFNYLCINRFGHFAIIVVDGAMTAKALLGIKQKIAALVLVGIVAGLAIKLTAHKTFAALQKLNLVAVYIKVTGINGANHFGQFVIGKRVAGDKSKS